MWKPVNVTRGLIVSGFLLLFIVRVHLFATRNPPFACWCHNTCVAFSQVPLVPVPLIQEQIAQADQHGWTCRFLAVQATARVDVRH